MCVAHALAPGVRKPLRDTYLRFGDAVMGSYDGQRAAAHVRAFTAEAAGPSA